MITDPLFYVLATFVVVMLGISKTGIPGLMAGMGVPLLALAISPAQGAAIMLPVLCVIDLFGLRAYRGVYDRRNMPIIVSGLLVGIVLGALTFSMMRDEVLRLMVGAIAVVFALNNLSGWAKSRPPTSASWPRGVFWSGLSGYTSFLTHSGNAPIMTYLLPQRLPRQIYVGTTVWYFFVSNYAKIVPYALIGQFDRANLMTSLVLLPLVPVGVKLGVYIQGRLNERVFYQISYWSLLAIGIKLLYDGITRL